MSIDAISSSIASSYVAAQWAVPTVRVSPQTDGYPEPVAPIEKAVPIDTADVSWSALAGEGAAVWPTWNPGRPYGLDPREAERRSALAVLGDPANVQGGKSGGELPGAREVSDKEPNPVVDLKDRAAEVRADEQAQRAARGTGMADGIGGMSQLSLSVSMTPSCTRASVWAC